MSVITWSSVQVESGSCFRLDRFESALLPDNNRPLEPSVLLALKELFVRADARTTSLHMLSVDCKVQHCFLILMDYCESGTVVTRHLCHLCDTVSVTQ